jgi:hypothetical protein
MDRRIRAERAWMIPYEIGQRLGSFEFDELAQISERKWRGLMSKPTPLHCFPSKMASEAFLAIQRIGDIYNGDASRIWSNRPSSAAVVSRFLAFTGMGPKVSTMATNILARDFKVPMSDHYSIDISVDTHVDRVLQRLGIVPIGATKEQITYAARSINPEFPGILDFPAWEIGREWCKAKTPICNDCYMNDKCPKIF